MFGMIPFSHRDDSLFHMLDTFEKSFPAAAAEFSAFRADIRDNGDSFLLEAELPGFRKEDISLDVHEGVLTITAKHEAESEEKNVTYLRRERRSGSFSRRFDLSGIDESAITASYQDGILALTLPKQAPVVPERRQIAIA